MHEIHNIWSQLDMSLNTGNSLHVHLIRFESKSVYFRILKEVLFEVYGLTLSPAQSKLYA